MMFSFRSIFFAIFSFEILGLQTRSYSAEISFAKEIAPLLESHCLKCHSGSKPKGALDLTSRKLILEGGISGEAITPGKSSTSLLWKQIQEKKMPPKEPLANEQIILIQRWIDEGAKWEGGDLKPKAIVKKDERGGPDWWSLQPIRRPEIPQAKDPNWVRNPIDAFVRCKQEEKNLYPSKEADRRTYIRRVTLDLTGLLPTPQEVQAFIDDASIDAYEKLVDRLLASPAYGETWARHWLDVVRFAESHGYEMNTLRPTAWHYRDYVIGAFNNDIAFGDFVRHQFAADTDPKADPITLGATGFLVAGPHDLVGNATVEGELQKRSDDLFDMVSTTSTAFLGLTVGCARCHDHKFDPILQKDFYRMEAIFAGVDHGESPIPSTSNPEERKRQIVQLKDQLNTLNQQIDEAEGLASSESTKQPTRGPVNPLRNVERFKLVDAKFLRFTILKTNDNAEPCIDEIEVFSPNQRAGNIALASNRVKPSASSEYPNTSIHKIVHINNGKFGNPQSWISQEPGKGWIQLEFPTVETFNRVVWARDREGRFQDRLAIDYRIEVSLNGDDWKPIAGSWDRVRFGSKQIVKGAKELDELRKKRDLLRKQLEDIEKPSMAYLGQFRNPDKTFVLKRGNIMQKEEEVLPMGLSVLKTPFSVSPNASHADRRLALANWIAHPENPLPARVLVNRIWHYHFGQGIVRTPSDFGFNGDRPSHPELLDWLASEYQRNGGKLKPLHKLIVLSNTYRQSSIIDERNQIDAGNRYLWRFSGRRLEAEKIRDTMLQVSGILNSKMGGPGYHIWDYSGYVIVFTPKKKLGPEEFRRMIYQFKPRTQQDGTFGVFDCPDATAVTPKRTTSTTALQALNLLNDAFIHDLADQFAERVKRESGEDVTKQVDYAFQMIFQRTPSKKEALAAEGLVKKHGLSILCRALFNANEFVMVE